MTGSRTTYSHRQLSCDMFSLRKAQYSQWTHVIFQLWCQWPGCAGHLRGRVRLDQTVAVQRAHGKHHVHVCAHRRQGPDPGERTGVSSASNKSSRERREQHQHFRSLIVKRLGKTDERILHLCLFSMQQISYAVPLAIATPILVPVVLSMTTVWQGDPCFLRCVLRYLPQHSLPFLWRLNRVTAQQTSHSLVYFPQRCGTEPHLLELPVERGDLDLHRGPPGCVVRLVARAVLAHAARLETQVRETRQNQQVRGKGDKRAILIAVHLPVSMFQVPSQQMFFIKLTNSPFQTGSSSCPCGTAWCWSSGYCTIETDTTRAKLQETG